MSFSNNCKSDKIPGPIKGNALSGICEKACIQADKVLDMCMRQETLQDVLVDVTSVTPTDLVQPYRFVSARSSTSQGVIENLVVTPLADSPCYARVSGNVVIPLQIALVDANGTPGIATGTIIMPKDVVLHISAPSVIPYSIQATVSAVAPKGTYAGNNVFCITACTTTILKVIMQVQLLVPSYGYCYIPPCQEFNEQVCDGVFDLPLYPQECGEECRCANALKG